MHPLALPARTEALYRTMSIVLRDLYNIYILDICVLSICTVDLNYMSLKDRGVLSVYYSLNFLLQKQRHILE